MRKRHSPLRWWLVGERERVRVVFWSLLFYWGGVWGGGVYINSLFLVAQENPDKRNIDWPTNCMLHREKNRDGVRFLLFWNHRKERESEETMRLWFHFRVGYAKLVGIFAWPTLFDLNHRNRKERLQPKPKPHFKKQTKAIAIHTGHAHISDITFSYQGKRCGWWWWCCYWGFQTRLYLSQYQVPELSWHGLMLGAESTFRSTPTCELAPQCLWGTHTTKPLKHRNQNEIL